MHKAMYWKKKLNLFIVSSKVCIELLTAKSEMI